MILRLLINMYIKQTMRASWNGCFSDFFTISNGVKQGGVLSPILFNIYIEDLILILRKYAIGCHISGCYAGIFSYADDLTLLAPSCESLNLMLGLCETYAINHDITFNSVKTKCMLFSNSIDENYENMNCIRFMGNSLSFVRNCILLGISLKVDIFDNNVCQSVNSFYAKSNSVRLDFQNLSYDVQFSLFSLYCIDAYGCQIWNFSDNSNDIYYVAWRKVLRRLWNLPYTTHTRLLPAIFETKSIDIQLEIRCIKFVHNCINSNNYAVNCITFAALNNRKSVLGINFRYLSFKYKIQKHVWKCTLCDVMKCVNNYVELSKVNSYDEYVRGALIRDLILNNDDNHILNNDEKKLLVNYLCAL